MHAPADLHRGPRATGALVLSSRRRKRARRSAARPVTALERALADRPDDAVLAYYLALFRARAGNRDGTLDALERVLEHGKGFLPPLDLFDTLQ